MNIVIAALLVAHLASVGKPATLVDNKNGTALVVMDGRPGCRAEALHGDPKSPIIVCEPAKPAR